MIRVLFVCHGNICRSTMAQFVFQHMVNNQGLKDKFYIDSAATSREEIGNPPHYGTVNKLRQEGIPVYQYIDLAEEFQLLGILHEVFEEIARKAPDALAALLPDGARQSAKPFA